MYIYIYVWIILASPAFSGSSYAPDILDKPHYFHPIVFTLKDLTAVMAGDEVGSSPEEGPFNAALVQSTCGAVTWQFEMTQYSSDDRLSLHRYMLCVVDVDNAIIILQHTDLLHMHLFLDAFFFSAIHHSKPRNSIRQGRNEDAQSSQFNPKESEWVPWTVRWWSWTKGSLHSVGSGASLRWNASQTCRRTVPKTLPLSWHNWASATLLGPIKIHIPVRFSWQEWKGITRIGEWGIKAESDNFCVFTTNATADVHSFQGLKIRRQAGPTSLPHWQDFHLISAKGAMGANLAEMDSEQRRWAKTHVTKDEKGLSTCKSEQKSRLKGYQPSNIVK